MRVMDSASHSIVEVVIAALLLALVAGAVVMLWVIF